MNDIGITLLTIVFIIAAAIFIIWLLYPASRIALDLIVPNNCRDRRNFIRLLHYPVWRASSSLYAGVLGILMIYFDLGFSFLMLVPLTLMAITGVACWREILAIKRAQ